MDDLEALQSIRNSCPYCGGSGSLVVTDPVDQHIVSPDIVDFMIIYPMLTRCYCIDKISKEVELIRANIPTQYRGFDLRNLTDEFINKNKEMVEKVKKFKDNIVENIEGGKSLWFMSSPGLGKSSLISVILKAAVRAGKTAYFDRASHLLALKFEALRDPVAKKKVDYLINEVDILAIEELEKIYLVNDSSFGTHLFYEFLSDLYDSKKSLLISSNEPKETVEMRFPTYIRDRMVHISRIALYGSSERKRPTKENGKNSVQS